ncbi:hypothetical protein [Nitrobacter sp. JJSN]|uniref:hypothetical protein n=1 Tax=Nitrobacter sp. JJSN TaxID=3453033 RepID=UPI003F76A001
MASRRRVHLSGSAERLAAIQQNFVLAPAHAHLNLVGGVLLFLFGLYYRVFPAAGRMTLARIQGWLHILGSILFPSGIALVLVGGKVYIAALHRIVGRGVGDGAVCGRGIPHPGGLIIARWHDCS